MSEQQVEQEARNLGWVPQEEFKGAAEKWVDADAFVERGKHIMPILQKNNERLQTQLHEQALRTEKLEQLLQASQESIAALEEHHNAATKRQVEKARSDLLAELKAAKAAGDADAEVQIVDELTQLKEAGEAKPAEKKEVKQEVAQVKDLPEVAAFKVANADWYGVDKKKTVQFNRTAEDLRLEGNTLVGQPFLDLVMQRFNEANRQGNSKVEGGGSRGGGGQAPSGRRFADLPKEAKDACHADNKRLVGEGRRFKTVGDWEAAYTKLYFGDENE